MNEELQKALGELLNKANNGIDAASGFLAAELPDVIQQLLMWHAASSLITFLLCIIIPVISYKASMNIARKTFLQPDNYYIDYPHVIVPMGVLAFIVSIACMANINITWLQIWIAPKVWLLEYAASLTK